MTNWEYMIEQYKVEYHFLEVVIQSLSVPIMLITLAVIMCAFKDDICSLIKGINKYSKFKIGNLFLAEKDKNIDEVKLKEIETIKNEFQRDTGNAIEKKDRLSNYYFVMLLLKNLDDAVTTLREKVKREAFYNKDEEVGISCINNNVFMKDVYKEDKQLHAFYDMYNECKAWENIDEQKKENISDDEVRKIAICVSMLQSEIITRIEYIFGK